MRISGNRAHAAPPRVKAMADAMVKTAQEERVVTRDRLIGQGFTPKEIESHGASAGALAATIMGGEV